MQAEASCAALPSVELLMPATWNRLELGPDGRAASIDRIVELTMKQGPEFEEARDRMRTELETAAELGAASGATLAYTYWAAPSGKLASASLFVALVDGGRASDSAPGSEDLPAAIAARYGGEVRALSAGRAARVRRRVRRPSDSGSGPEAEIVTWYVPHASGRRLAVLTFSTPNVGLADELGQVFDALADTLRWTA